MDRLQKAYDPEQFRQKGHQLIDLLADELQQSLSQDRDKVIPWKTPDDMLDFWKEDFQKQGHEGLFEKILANSIHLQHPKYMGHQVSVPAPEALLANLLSSYLNNGMAIYEMGMSSTAIEKIIINLVTKKFGFGTEAGGVMTSGGTLANLTALLAARAEKAPNHQGQQLALMVSEEAHYCVDRAVKTMGWGEQGIIKIPTNDRFQMRSDLLESHLQEATKNNIKVIAVVASACSTSTGSYDDISSIASFCKQYNLWLHIDGAHGAAVCFSNQHKHLLQGIELADSVTLDFHKMLMAPALATAIVFKNEAHSVNAFSQRASYLLTEEHDWYNLGKQSYECTKLMMCLKVYTLLKTHGVALFEENVNRLIAIAQEFATLIRRHPHFELAVDPQCNIVCFRYIDPNLDHTNLNEINHQIRSSLLEEGTFYIVKTTLKEKVYLRTTFMNPFTAPTDLSALLQHIVNRRK